MAKASFLKAFKAKALPLSRHIIPAIVGGIGGAYLGETAATTPPKGSKSLSDFGVNTSSKGTFSRLKRAGGLPPGTNLVTAQDLRKKLKNKKLSPGIKKELHSTLSLIEDGNNAAVDDRTKTLYLPDRIDPKVMGHEIGHLHDYKINSSFHHKILDKFLSGTSGYRHKQEVRAWEKSPIKTEKDDPLRAFALSSYERHKNMGRAGLGLGGALGLGLSLLARKKH